MESNVTLRSNVYINKTNRRNDIEFVQHIRDYSSLSRYYDPVYRKSEVPFTQVQEEILRHGPPKCALESGTMSWGVPMGSERFVCRCENEDCQRYSICSADAGFERIDREPDTEMQEETPPDSMTEEEEIVVETAQPERSISYKDEESGTSAVPVLTEPIIDISAMEEEQNITYFTQDAVVNAGIDSRIWVNAGPGTGKTYTVIKRLQKLIDRGISSDKVILVLCFSKNAVREIRERLHMEMGDYIDELMADEQLMIRTFDSFATYMLNDDLPRGLSYDQRIELFIEKSKEHPDLLSNVEYLIVDEVQDTVGVRARMLQSIIEKFHSGVLLLGDRCQAIYDWSTRANNDWTSENLFRWVSSQGFQSCELQKNYRQTQELGLIGETVRRSLLGDSEEEQEQVLSACKEKIESLWPGCEMQDLPQKLCRQSELILCKTNGEAAVMSDLLYGGQTFVEHAIMQNAGHKSLAPWIGMILGGCTAPIISKDDFITRAEAHEITDIETKWEALKSIDRHPRSAVLYRHEVLTCLAAMEALPEVCLNRPGNGVIVSTVHRAKGSEADHVYWLNSPLVYDNSSEKDGVKADALKASYVAVTRAKRDIRLVQPEKVYMRSLDNDRWIKIGWSGKNRQFCGGIALQPNDVDLISCVCGPEVQEMQDTIGTLIPGLNVDLYPASDGSYFEILLEGFPIGKTSAAFMRSLREGFRVTNGNANMPLNIDSAYISALVTVVQLGKTTGENAYQESGCWLGYELGGFAHINYT